MTTPTRGSVPYVPPALHVLGRIEKLTEVHYKQFGSTDGFTYQGQAITNASV
jgi:hypothetical protein